MVWYALVTYALATYALATYALVTYALVTYKYNSTLVSVDITPESAAMPSGCSMLGCSNTTSARLSIKNSWE
mgnify:FL=1